MLKDTLDRANKKNIALPPQIHKVAMDRYNEINKGFTLKVQAK